VEVLKTRLIQKPKKKINLVILMENNYQIPLNNKSLILFQYIQHPTISSFLGKWFEVSLGVVGKHKNTPCL
jgi:hypothetical protein